MCQYSAEDGVPNDWHLVHLGSRAVGGAALVIAEATGVSPEGRITDGDLGIWNDTQAQAFKKITDFIKAQNSIPGIQIAHAGRKASTKIPWVGHGGVQKSEGGWTPLAPSAVAYSDSYILPKEMTKAEIEKLKEDFFQATRNALKAGFQVLEIHMAHGYMLNEFLSPLANKRTDEYGGSLENRMNLPLQVAQGIREIWPKDLPVFARISAKDWVDGGWDVEDSIAFSKRLKEIGIDLVDCSSGGVDQHQKIKVVPGYQVDLSDAVRNKANIPTGAVGIITEAKQAEEILKQGQADLIFIARELLRDPYWPLHAAKILGDDIPWPNQYARAKNPSA